MVAMHSLRWHTAGMKFIMMFLVAAGVAAVVYSISGKSILEQRNAVQQEQGIAEQKADAYRKNQEEMMKQLGQ
jgi:hypothetical protein